MFAQASTHLPFPSSRIAALVGDPDHPWSVGLDGNGHDLLAKVGVRIAGVPLYRHVRLRIGSPPAGTLKDRVMLPVSWEAVGGPPLFPAMEGILHVNPAGEGETKITLNVRYDPPLGQLGEVLDRTLLHRLGQATIEDFVNRLAANLEARLSC